MNWNSLENLLAAEPAFRRRQVKEAIFKNLIESWRQATSLSLALRERLEAEAPLDIRAKLVSSGVDKVDKALISYDDGSQTETVLMEHRGGRLTACLSCQIGCALDCAFCATGRQGFARNLTAEEIIVQALYWQRRLKASGRCLKNVVFMGMGEPFLNYDEVLKAIRLLNDKDAFNIGARHISVSTAGLPEGILKLAREPFQVNLAISLHAPDDELRSELMPINRRHKIKDILKAVDEYILKTKRQVMFEYLLLDGINDSPEQAKQLAAMMKKPLYMVNLLNFNETFNFKASPPERRKKFKEILDGRGVKATWRRSFGPDIDAACGQLAKRGNTQPACAGRHATRNK